MRLVGGSLVAVLGFAALQSCSDDEAKPGDTGTGGADASVGGSGGAGGSGGTAGSGGAAGSGGSTDASVEAGDASDGGLVCTPIPDDADPDAATAQWRDWAANACKACPATAATCDLLVGAGATFDPVSKVVTFKLSPGVAEVVSGTVSFNWDALDADGGFVNGSVSSQALSVDKNTLTASLAGQVPDGVYSVNSLVLDLDDACGENSVINDFSGNVSAGDASPVLNIHCEQ